MNAEDLKPDRPALTSQEKGASIFNHQFRVKKGYAKRSSRTNQELEKKERGREWREIIDRMSRGGTERKSTLTKEQEASKT